MADDSPLALSNTLIGGRFAVDTSQILLDAGGGIATYRVHDRQAGDAQAVALSVSRSASPRARPLRILTEPVDNLMVPLAHGVAPLPGGKGEGYYIICTSPPGPPVSASLSPWPEKALIDLVLRPAARVLDVLYNRGMTHRAIRPNNVFQQAPGQPVTLGAAWAAPAAMHQPAAFESPYTVMCHPAGRGDGTIADDIYALGVLLLTLAGGKMPLANMDDGSVVRWKLDQGSFAALTRDISLSGSLSDLLRGMLAEDPDHRPLPAQLLDPGATRTRRVVARPPRRSQRPLMLNDIAVFDARTLGYALAGDEKRAIQFLQNGIITQWLRRDLGDASLAAQIEELVRGRMADTRPGQRSDSLLVMLTISAINPRMPLCWRGVLLWPDSLPALLAEGIAQQSDLMGLAEELLVQDVCVKWADAESRQGRPDAFSPNPEMLEERRLLHSSGAGGLLRLFYRLNPILPCRAPSVAAEWIADVPRLMGFLEQAAEKAGSSLIDLHIAAFIAARGDRRIEMQIHSLTSAKDASAFRAGEFALLRDLQMRYHPSPMPQLAKWLAARLRPDIEQWRNRNVRQALLVRLDALAQAGLLARLLELAEDTRAWAVDSAGAQHASAERATIEWELAAIDKDDKVRLADAERFGQAITGGIGLSAFILMLMSVLLP